jgi:protein-tyrosine phosphatase
MIRPEATDMSANLYWVKGPWPGKLALAARPRGGEWLADEMDAWKQAGVNAVLSLLMPDEEEDLGVSNEAAQAKALGLEFLSFPIPDRQVPQSRDALTKTLEKVDRQLTDGRNVVLHCRQGVGRTGLVAACLLLTKGVDADSAVRRVSEARGVRIPETPEQRRWIDQYAGTFAGTD